MEGRDVAIDNHRGKWRARWRDENGAQRAKSFETKKQATAYLASVTTDIKRGLRTSYDGSISVAELAEMWIDASIHLSPGTLWTYQRDLNRYILPTFGDLKVSALTPPAVQRWLAQEMQRLAPSSVRRHHRTLATMLNWAVDQGIAAKNVVDKVKAPRIPRRDMETFTVEQIEAIAAAIPKRYKCLVLVAAYGGLRWSELVGLRRMDVQGARVTVAGQLIFLNKQWLREDPKTAAGRRTIVLPQSVAIELQAHLEQFTGPKPSDLIFTSSFGKPIAQSFRRNIWYPACYAAGMGEQVIRNYKPAFVNMPRFHDLRHTSVALAINAGAHPKAIQQRLGHASIAITMDRYGHLMAGMDAELAGDLDDLRSAQ
jgi:integrase